MSSKDRITAKGGEVVERARLEEAESRLFDMCLGDDGQAWKEAERYLERHRPDLFERL